MLPAGLLLRRLPPLLTSCTRCTIMLSPESNVSMNTQNVQRKVLIVCNAVAPHTLGQALPVLPVAAGAAGCAAGPAAAAADVAARHGLCGCRRRGHNAFSGCGALHQHSRGAVVSRASERPRLQALWAPQRSVARPYTPAPAPMAAPLQGDRAATARGYTDVPAGCPLHVL